MKRELTFMVFFTAISLIGVASADTQDTIILPFDFNGRICGELENGNYVCEWDPNYLDIREVAKNGTTAVPNPDVVSSNINATETIITPEIKVIETTTIDKRHDEAIKRFEDNPPKSNADKEYSALLENLAQCRQGYANSAGVAADEWFDISFTWVNDGEAWAKSIDYQGQFGDLKKAIEECQAIRTVLNPVVLGDGYYARGQYFGQTQTYHAEIAGKVPIYSQERINQESNAQVNPNAWSIEEDICNGYYNDLWKKTFEECSIDYDKSLVNPQGFISYGNEIEDRWLQYQEDGGKAQTKESMDRIVSEKLSELRKSQAVQHRGLDVIP